MVLSKWLRRTCREFACTAASARARRLRSWLAAALLSAALLALVSLAENAAAAPSSTRISASPLVRRVPYGTTVYHYFLLLRCDTGQGLAGKPLSVERTGLARTYRTTGSDGGASIATVARRNATVRAAFAGDATWAPSRSLPCVLSTYPRRAAASVSVVRENDVTGYVSLVPAACYGGGRTQVAGSLEKQIAGVWVPVSIKAPDSVTKGVSWCTWRVTFADRVPGVYRIVFMYLPNTTFCSANYPTTGVTVQ